MSDTDATIGVAESLTGGQISANLAAAPGAGSWFRGGVVAYNEDVKHSLLSVPDVPIVSKACAQYMAENAARVLGADYAVAVTGEGGPDSQYGDPPGTVWLAVVGPNGNEARLCHFDDEPADIVARTVSRALRLVLEHADATNHS
ncbi:MAG: CinA family protein [Aldersonia sp.]|nr:CinA family protein [Aldersonia sp.]